MNIERVKYVVVKDKGIVRAIISGCEYDAFEAFHKKIMLPSTHYLALCANGDHEKFVMPYQFSAVARLHPEDEWDEETGKNKPKQHTKQLDNKFILILLITHVVFLPTTLLFISIL